MKQRPLLILIPVVALLIAALSIMASKKATHIYVSPDFMAVSNPNPTGFALVELFTSEGCSSCPAAEEALAKMATAYPSRVYILELHVDYWDRLGWKDIFSSPDYTRRQQEYSRIFGLNSIYTPQVVVNGEKEFVGSDENKLRSTIEADLGRPEDKAIELKAMTQGNTITANFKVPDAGVQSLHIALVQRHAESQVKAGENDGRLLKHLNVVRDLKWVDIHSGSIGSLSFTLPRDVSAGDCKLIAWLQKRDDKGGIITGATSAEIPVK